MDGWACLSPWQRRCGVVDTVSSGSIGDIRRTRLQITIGKQAGLAVLTVLPPHALAGIPKNNVFKSPPTSCLGFHSRRHGPSPGDFKRNRTGMINPSTELASPKLSSPTELLDPEKRMTNGSRTLTQNNIAGCLTMRNKTFMHNQSLPMGGHQESKRPMHTHETLIARFLVCESAFPDT